MKKIPLHIILLIALAILIFLLIVGVFWWLDWGNTLQNRVRFIGLTSHLTGLFIGSRGLYSKIKVFFKMQQIWASTSFSGGSISEVEIGAEGKGSGSDMSLEKRVDRLENQYSELYSDVEGISSSVNELLEKYKNLKFDIQNMVGELKKYVEKTFETKFKDWQVKSLHYELIGFTLIVMGIIVNSLSPEIAAYFFKLNVIVSVF